MSSHRQLNLLPCQSARQSQVGDPPTKGRIPSKKRRARQIRFETRSVQVVCLGDVFIAMMCSFPSYRKISRLRYQDGQPCDVEVAAPVVFTKLFVHHI